MAEESALLSSQPSGSGVMNDMVVETTTCIPGTSWGKEMDNQDPLSDDDDSEGTTSRIHVVPVTERTDKFLTELFSHRFCIEKYMLPKNEQTKAPFLDAMMGSQCSKTMKSSDRSISKLQGLILDAVGPLTQLLEVVNDEQPQVTMEQVGEAVETALSLLANASYQMSAMQQSKILEEYNKELLTFAAAKNCDWVSAAPYLFGPNFLKEASDYLQQLQLLRKVKEKPSGFWQAPSREAARTASCGGIHPTPAQATTPKRPLSQRKGLPQRND